MAERREAKSDVTLEEELSQQDKLPPGQHFMEETAFMVLGESEGCDFAMLSCIFRVGGGKQGMWEVDDTASLQTTVQIVPQSERGNLNNEFIGNRCFAKDWSGDCQIIKEKDRIIWQRDKIQHIRRPPYWELKGEHMGVEFDLSFAGYGHTVYWMGPFEGLADSGQAGFSQLASVEGTIKARGKTYPITPDKAVGEVNKFLMTSDIAELFQITPYYWLWCIGQDMSMMIYYIPDVFVVAEVMVDGRSVSYEMDDLSFDELDWWVDPKTGVRVPTRWHINLSSKEGVTDVIASANSRMFYSYMMKSGVTIHYGMLSRAQGRFFSPDGRTFGMNDAPSYIEWGRTVLPLGSGSM